MLYQHLCIYFKPTSLIKKKKTILKLELNRFSDKCQYPYIVQLSIPLHHLS